MDKLLIHIFLWLFVDDRTRITKAMDTLFGNETTEVVKVKENKVIVKPKPVNNKRDEIMDAINYLKSKSNKTKSDREKIQMLEVILKSARGN
jgi:hypothetical protein